MSKIKAILKGKSKLGVFLRAVYNNLPFNNKISHKKGNRVINDGFLKGCKINFRGKNNTIQVKHGVFLENCSINIS